MDGVLQQDKPRSGVGGRRAAFVSIRYALLGLLREEPDYGYRLKKRFDERVGNVWRLNIGQVYQTLQSLEKAGLVCEQVGQSEDGEEEGGAARRRYQLTDKGVALLETWLRRAPARPQPVRDELLVRLLLLEPERSEEALVRIRAQIRTYKAYMSRLLAKKRKIANRGFGAGLVASLGVEAALFHTAAHIRWLEHAALCIQEETKSRSGAGD